MRTSIFMFEIMFLIILTQSAMSQSWVASVAPTQNALNVDDSTNIIITFTQDINPVSLTNNTIRVNGSQSGIHFSSNISYDAVTRAATFDPDSNFYFGEVLFVTITTGVQNLIGDPMPNPFNWGFTIEIIGGSSTFINAINTSVGARPRAVNAGDFNLDGNLDLAVANGDANTISILINDGSGNFMQSSAPTVGNEPVSITDGDLDSDGNLDLAVANTSSHNVSILMNDGSGNFVETSTPSAGNFPGSITAGDFDGDGDLDLGVANGVIVVTVSILENDGTGGFIQSALINLGSVPRSITTGDWDNDGDLDLAVGTGSNNVSILTNDGNGNFNQTSTPSVGSAPESIITGDWDGDGDLDLAVSNFSSSSLSILMNNGNGGFSQSSMPSVGTNPRSLTSGDFDDDGDLDLGSTNSGSNTVSILTNNGNGSFIESFTSNVENFPISITAGDLENDGDLDLVAVNKFSNTVSILKNISIVQNIRLLNNLLDFGIIKSNQSKSLTFQIMNEAALNPLIISNITSSTPSVFSVTPTSAIINALDTLTVKVTFTSNEVRQYIDSLTILSDDPDEPIVNLFLTGTSAPVVISSTPSRNSVNANDSTDILATFNSPMLQSTIQNSNFFAYGEISGRNSVNISYEGTTSAVTLNPDSNFVIGEKVQVVITEDIKSDPDSIPLVHGYTWKFNVAPKSGSGFFNLFPLSFMAGPGPFAISVGDMNNDRYSDFVISNSGGNSATVFLNNQNNGFDSSATYSLGMNPQGITVADINGDGNIDIITSNSSSNNISVLENLGDGTFGNLSTFSVGNFPRPIVATDLNNDGYIDVVTGNVNDNSISILFNDQMGNFQTTIDIAVGSQPNGLGLEDIDNDGDIDIAVNNKSSNNISILLNDSGSFTVDSTYTVGNAPNGLAAHDLDGDGDVDLATANGTSNDISILYNNGNGVFSGLSTLAAGSQPIAIFAHDFNSDRDVDLAVANFSSNDVMVFQNIGNGTFLPNDTIMVETGPRNLTGLDVSGTQGRIDLITVNLIQQDVSLLRNIDLSNNPPVVINQINDVIYEEDSGPHIVIDDLNTVFSDTLDNDPLFFNVENSDSSILAAIENQVRLVISSDSNFFGQREVMVSATDGFDTITDTFMVTIEPVNDPPVIEDLPDSVMFDADSSVTLNIWQYAEDVETPDDSLFYRFYDIDSTLNYIYDNSNGNLIISSKDTLFNGMVLMHVEVEDDSGASAMDSITVIVHPITGIQNSYSNQVPTNYVLMQNYPNPFNPITYIRFGIPQTSDVTITIYNTLGQRVAVLLDKRFKAGYHSARFDARNFTSGLYFYHIKAGGFQSVKKLLLLK